MEEKILESKSLSVDEYLRLFEEGSADYEMVKKRSANLERIELTLLLDGQGRRVEDTTFHEKTGVHYTIRSVLD